MELLKNRQIIRVEELSKIFSVSVVTIRKDLQRLEDEGKLLRTFGGVTSCVSDSKEQKRRVAMQSIAKRVVQEIREDDFIILNAGTTTMLTAWELREKKIKAITNSISAAREIKRHKGSKAILLGGELARDAAFTHGSEAIEQLKQYKANKLILSISGISCSAGVTTRHMEAAELFRWMIACAEEVIMVADETKIGFESFYNVGDLKVVDKLITNFSEGNEEELQQMERLGVCVCRC